MKRFEVWLTEFDPAKGAEMKKTRPAVILSPDSINKKLFTLIIAPLTSTSRDYPTRISTRFGDIDGQIVLDQIRTVDKKKLIKKLGTLDNEEAVAACRLLGALFKY